MNTSKPRKRAVIFRITQEEYNSLKSACSAGGARSLSDFARSRVLRALGEPSLSDVGQRINQLEQAVQQLAEVISHGR
jgi:hypothetical protein